MNQTSYIEPSGRTESRQIMTGFDLGFIRLQEESREPLFEQLAESLRKAILGGKLARGHRLPSSRDLARQLVVSRTTVVTAFEQLVAEGYLQSTTGAGTYVSEQLPEEQQIVRFSGLPRPSVANATAPQAPYLSDSAQRWLEEESSEPREGRARLQPFRPGVPALDAFPVELWSRIYRQRWRRFSESDLSYGPTAGYEPLRKSIASYVGLHRGVRCTADQVVIVLGTQQAVDLVGRITIERGDGVLFEDPGYRNARASLIANGAKIIPMQVDEQGAVLSSRLRARRDVKLAYVTPSHQYPLGVTLSIERRMELIDWASESGGLILEDDYDSEYRYAQRPIPSLQGLDGNDRTIYIGSFSKVVFPALSMGYVVLPKPMVEALVTMQSIVGRTPSLLDQVVLNDFIEEGHFDRHLRRMRGVHRSRRDALVEAVQRYVPKQLELLGDEAGLHSAARLKGPRAKSDRSVSARLLEQKIVAPAISDYYFDPQVGGARRSKKASEERTDRVNGLVLGFASTSPSRIRAAVRKMAGIL